MKSAAESSSWVQLAKKVKKDVKSGNFRFTAYAIERCVERDIAPVDVKAAILTGEIIEHYPTDKYGESCLICGIARSDKILHVNCFIYSIHSTSQQARIH
jgi:hypothetical protein